ncbi:EamA family transporter [Aliarcobacter cryaerophilus]|uniref:EamA family transporter n=1 Tax=Aliarcobacter cryaerophilus TaxID=28198 RepID=UPI0036F40B4C
MEKLGAVNASSSTYIPPVVALLIGYFLVGEDITLIDLLATALIFSGVFMINMKKR